MEHTFAQQPSTGPNLTDWHEMSWFDAAALHAKYPGKYEIQTRIVSDNYTGIWDSADGAFYAKGSWVYRAKLLEEPIKLINTEIPNPYMVEQVSPKSIEITFWNPAHAAKAYRIIENLVNDDTIA